MYAWLARNSVPKNPIDGGTVVMISNMLKQNISIISNDHIWNCEDHLTDIGLVYTIGKFLPTEVSTSMFLSLFDVMLLSHF